MGIRQGRQDGRRARLHSDAGLGGQADREDLVGRHQELIALEEQNFHTVIPRCAIAHLRARVKRANPESITTIESMDSWPAPSGASTMCNCTSLNDDVWS